MKDKTTLEFYEALPDSIPPLEVINHFEELLIIDKRNQLEKIITAQSLLELMYRQWYTYQKLPEAVSHKILDWLIRNWDENDFELIDTINAIFANLASFMDMKKGVSFLKKAKENASNASVKNSIEETLSEIQNIKAEDKFY